MIITARHPAPIEESRRGRRKPELTWATTETQVSLREAHGVEAIRWTLSPWEQPDDQAFGQAYLHDGGVWRPLRWAGRVSRPGIIPALLKSYLEGDPKASGLLDVNFRGTPILAHERTDTPDEASEPLFLRGSPYDPSRARIVHADGRDEAAAALRSYVSQNLRVLDGYVIQRQACVMTWRRDPLPSGGHVMMSNSALVDPFQAIPFGSSTVGDLGDSVAPGRRFDDRTVRSWFQSVPGECLRGSEHRALANGLPAALCIALRDRLDPRSPRRIRDREVADRMRALYPSLRKLEIEACIGLPGLADPRDALRILVPALAQIDEAFGLDPRSELKIPVGKALLMRLIETAYIPTLPDPDMPDDDVEALGAFMPDFGLSSPAETGSDPTDPATAASVATIPTFHAQGKVLARILERFQGDGPAWSSRVDGDGRLMLMPPDRRTLLVLRPSAGGDAFEAIVYEDPIDVFDPEVIPSPDHGARARLAAEGATPARTLSELADDLGYEIATARPGR